MKTIRRSGRVYLPHSKEQFKLAAKDNDKNKSNVKFKKSIIRSNKNANRTPTIVLNTIKNVPTQGKQYETLSLSLSSSSSSSSNQSSSHPYSINVIQQLTTISGDLTSLTKTTTNTTPLTTLTHSNTKQTEAAQVDLTELSLTDIIDNSSISTDHDRSLSINAKISLTNINNEHNSRNDLSRVHEPDTSMKSIVFSKDSILEREGSSYHTHLSCFTIPSVRHEGCITKASTLATRNIYVDQKSSSQWAKKNVTDKLKILLGCSSLSLLIAILMLVIVR